jgi:hypothetical protein
MSAISPIKELFARCSMAAVVAAIFTVAPLAAPTGSSKGVAVYTKGSAYSFTSLFGGMGALAEQKQEQQQQPDSRS